MKDYPDPLPAKSIQKISEQTNNFFYKINEDKNQFEIGFFCYIKTHNTNIPTLIINNNHSKEAKYQNTIEVKINKSIKIIELGETRYKDDKNGISILEIREKKEDNLNFVEIDDKLCEYESEMYYIGDSIYILQYNDFKQTYVSFGLINDIDDSQITYSGNINTNSEGSPIFSASSNKLIGIHQSITNCYNRGKFLKLSIKDFIARYEHIQRLKYKKEHLQDLENHINIIINIKKSDINKTIYFLDNYEYEDEEGVKRFHDNIKELNKENTELFINNKKYEYKNYLIPKRKGLKEKDYIV